MTTARLAVVDDDKLFGQFLSVQLTALGYEVSTYARGEDLLSALTAGSLPDVVLLDVLMPGLSGLETLRAVRAKHPDVQVIMLSGTQVPATIVDAVRLGAVDYVVKPDDPQGHGEAALEAAIRSAVEKVNLTREVVRLRAQIAETPDDARPYWGSDPAMQPVLTLIERVADSDVSVLISGESGVGKEVVARELHRQSSRRGRTFVKVTCAALPSELLESELFGHERGAFTGAQTARMGKFEYAHQSTIMLDEIGEMPLPLQAKLLHVLQDRTFTRLGSNRPVSVDVRIIAASNRDLAQMIRAGRFREDLYYRLQVIEIRVPPLRERPDEILPLMEFFLVKYAAHYGRRVATPSRALREAFTRHHWPGNVRELENVIKRYVILEDEALVLSEIARQTPADDDGHASASGAPADKETREAERDTPGATATADGPPLTLIERGRRAAERAERLAIDEALTACRWNRRQAARQLGISYKTLLNKMKSRGITPQGGD